MRAPRARVWVAAIAAIVLLGASGAAAIAWSRCGDGGCTTENDAAAIALPVAGAGVLLAVGALLLAWQDGRDRTHAAVAPGAPTVTPNPVARIRELRPEVHAVAFPDLEQTLRLNAVRDAARSLDAGAYRLQQTSVRTMTAMMRLRRALARRETTAIDTPPAWMRRAAEQLEVEDGPRVIQIRR